MTQPPRVASGTTSAEVIAASAKIITRKGISNFGIEGVARELDVEPRHIRYWFISEADILAALMTLRQQQFMDVVQRRHAEMPSHSARLCGLFEICTVNPDATLWIELWKLGLREPVARECRQRVGDRYGEMITKLIRSGQAAGEFGDAPAAQIATAIVSLIIGLSVQTTLRDPLVTPEYMRSTLVAAAERLLDADLASASSSG